MSITSSNNQKVHADFADLLARHAGLAGWLSNVFYSQDELRAEELLPRFLAECREQAIPATAYPFTAEDQGLADLRAYLQSAREEIDLFRSPASGRKYAEQAVSHSQQDHEGQEETPTDTIPVVRATSSGSLSPAETHEKSTNTEEIAVAGLATAHVPVATLETGQLDAAEATPPNMIVSEEAAIPTEDVTLLETAHMAVTTLQGGAEESSENASSQEKSEPRTDTASSEQEKTESDVAAEDVTQLETAHMPIAAQETTDAVATTEASAAGDTAIVQETATSEAAPEQREPEAAERKRAPATQRRRSKRVRRPRTRRQRIISWIVLVVVLATVLIPAISLVSFGLNAYNTYHNLSDQAHSAVNHLLDVKTTLSSGKSGQSRFSGLFDTNKLQRAKQDFVASGQDFQQLQKQLKQSSTLQTITTYFPQYRETLSSAQAASQIGIDVAAIGQIATSHVTEIAPSFSGSLLAPTGKPLVTQAVLDTLTTTIDQVTPLLTDIQAQAQHVSLDALPISASEKAQVGQLLQVLPQVVTDLGITRSLLGDAGWLLGVNQPRTFLVQTMDRAELRGAGGFTGQYGELTINGGRVAPFSLKDISLVEYTNTSVTQGQLAPQQYRSWWPFANWGLRDSNVSADFPTTASLAINLYKQETGDQVDGVISFTPVVIEHVLAVIGPIQVPGYNTTVTAQNLEDMLHYYQLDNRGILKQILNQPNNSSTSQRKRFTNYLTTLLMDKVRSSSLDQLLAIGHQVLADLKSKDLQVYFTDPASEDVLMKYGYAGVLDRSTTHDGLYVVQQNLSASKASQYVQTILHDTVTLDSKGGATHTLQIRLVYDQAGPVYGYDTYYDYLRVYVPPASQLLSGDGFSSGTPLCGGAYGDCPIDGPYPGGELTCPSGQYQPGATPPSLTIPDGGTWQPLQTLSGPTNTASDEEGRAMYGGWVIVPKNCTMNVTLSWYVPPMSTQPYSLLVQRQAGTFPELDLTILPDAANCAQLSTAGLHSDTTLTRDTSFSLPTSRASAQAQGKNCYPHMGV